MIIIPNRIVRGKVYFVFAKTCRIKIKDTAPKNLLIAKEENSVDEKFG